MDELKKLLAEATPSGDWSVDENTVWSNDRGVPIADVRIGAPTWYKGPKLPYQANAALIVAAVNALPELIALRADMAKLNEPDGVLVNMLRGTIPKVPAASLHKLYTEDELIDAAKAVFRARAALNQEPKT